LCSRQADFSASGRTPSASIATPQAEPLRRSLHAREGQRFGQHDISGRRPRQQRIEQDRLVAGIDDQALRPRRRNTASQPLGRNLALVVAAAGRLVVQERAESGFFLDRLEALCDVQIEIGFQRLRRNVHREVDLDRVRHALLGAQRRFGNEGAAPDLRRNEAAPARFAIGARHSGQIEPQGARQRAMRRDLLPALEPAGRDVGRQRVDDAFEGGARPFRKCREPIHTILDIVLACMDLYD
jgi:hypothetical protein